METPSSTSHNNLPVSKGEESVGKLRERKQEDRCALFDISNSSPIVGLAKGTIEKWNTPCSGYGYGEALLRGQVKSLMLEQAQSSRPNTPGTHNGLVTIASPVVDQILISQAVNEIFNGECVITRSLLVDFSNDDDDGASVWSIEVNASSSTHDEEEEVDVYSVRIRQ